MWEDRNCLVIAEGGHNRALPLELTSLVWEKAGSHHRPLLPIGLSCGVLGKDDVMIRSQCGTDDALLTVLG